MEARRVKKGLGVFGSYNPVVIAMTYELRTPMNTMLGMNEMIWRESSEKEIQGYAKEVADAGAYRFWNHHIGISA